MITIIVDVILLVIVTVASVVMFVFSLMDIFSLLLSVLPMAVATLFSVIEYYRTIRRKDKIIALGKMYRICKHLEMVFDDYRRVELANIRARDSRFPPFDAHQNYEQEFNKYKTEIIRFIKLFGQQKRAQEILNLFKTDSRRMSIKLREFEKSMRLSEEEIVLLNKPN